jgi:hypothetical protein
MIPSPHYYSRLYLSHLPSTNQTRRLCRPLTPFRTTTEEVPVTNNNKIITINGCPSNWFAGLFFLFRATALQTHDGGNASDGNGMVWVCPVCTVIQTPLALGTRNSSGHPHKGTKHRGKGRGRERENELIYYIAWGGRRKGKFADVNSY